MSSIYGTYYIDRAYIEGVSHTATIPTTTAAKSASATCEVLLKAAMTPMPFTGWWKADIMSLSAP